MSDDKGNEVYYRLARSAVRISGTVTSDVDPRTTTDRRRVDGDISLEVQADSRIDWRCKLPIDGKTFKDKDLALELTDDGRLVSSEATTTGVGAALVEAGVRTVSLVGSFVFGGLGGLLRPEAPEPPPKSIEDVYEEEQATAAQRRRTYRASLDKLQRKLAEYGAGMADDPNPAAKLGGLRALQAALERIRAEATMIDVEFQAWRSARFPSSTEQHEFLVGTDELPNRANAPMNANLDVATLSQTQQDAARTLGIVVARVAEVDEDRFNHTTDDLQMAKGLWFRTARPVQLAVYEATEPPDGNSPPTNFTRTVLGWHWLVDKDSRMGFVRFDSGFFGKSKGKVGFGAAGTLTHLNLSEQAPAGRIAAALGGVGGQIKESLEQAEKISESLATARGRGADRRLADLKRQKELLQADIELKGALVTREDRGELERLGLEAKLLEARKDLVPEPEPAADRNKELKAELERTKLEVALMKLQVQERELSEGGP